MQNVQKRTPNSIKKKSVFDENVHNIHLHVSEHVHKKKVTKVQNVQVHITFQWQLKNGVNKYRPSLQIIRTTPFQILSFK